jgi:hypothetical protein
MTVRWTAALACVLLLLLGACGGGTDRTKAQVRLVNASTGYTALDLNVASTLVQGQVTYGNTASYVAVDPGNDASTINSSGSATALLSFTPTLSKGDHYSLLAFGNAGKLSQLQLDEDVGAPATNYASLRVVNGASDAGSVDIYLTGSTDALSASVPVLSGASVGTLGSAFPVASGTWRLRVTAAGSKSDVRLDISGVVLANQQIASLVLTPGVGGVLVNALLITQQGSILPLNGTQARLRVAAGVAGGGAVSASVGGTAVLSGVGSPAVTNYVLVPAGTPSAVLSVNGNPLATNSLTLTAGGDYTLLFYGPLSAPAASLIADDNHLPSDATQAQVRLVNGIANLSTPLALTVNYVPLAQSVSVGTASAYAFQPPSTTAAFSITTSGVALPPLGASTQTFLADANYTIFAVGDVSSPVAILSQDR